MTLIGEELREAMRLWAAGVSMVTSCFEGIQHGMTVNSIISISLFPVLVTITLANSTRTKYLVPKSSVFAITILEENQQELSEYLAGSGHPSYDLFKGLNIFRLISECQLLKEGIAYLDCHVVHQYEMPSLTLFVRELLAAVHSYEKWPLLHMNRNYFSVKR